MTPPTFTGPSGIVGIVPDTSGLAPVGLFSPDRIADALAAYAAFGWSGETMEVATDRDGRLLIRPREHRADGWIAVAPVRVDDEGEAAKGEAPVPPPIPKEEKTDRYDTGFPDKPPKEETKTWAGGDPRPLKTGESPRTADRDLAAPAPAPTAVAVCETCGGPVTKAQKQMSALFLNRTLCRTCLDKIKEGKA